MLMENLIIALYIVLGIIGLTIFVLSVMFLIVVPTRLQNISDSIDTLNETMNEIKDKMH